MSNRRSPRRRLRRRKRRRRRKLLPRRHLPRRQRRPRNRSQKCRLQQSPKRPRIPAPSKAKLTARRQQHRTNPSRGMHPQTPGRKNLSKLSRRTRQLPSRPHQWTTAVVSRRHHRRATPVAKPAHTRSFPPNLQPDGRARPLRRVNPPSPRRRWQSQHQHPPHRKHLRCRAPLRPLSRPLNLPKRRQPRQPRLGLTMPEAKAPRQPRQLRLPRQPPQQSRSRLLGR